MQRSATRTAPQSTLQLLQPGERIRLLAELATPVGKIAEAAYPPGCCEGRHSHRKASLIYIVDGDHWATHSRGGGTARAGTVRYLPAGEPHEVYFPLGSTCLQLELESSIIDLAAEQGRPLERPGEILDARAGPLGARLHDELFTSDDLSQIHVEELALQLLLAGEAAGHVRRRDAPPWLLRIGEQLREEFATRLALQAIARSAGRHPVQVSRQFHRHFGCTLSEYVRRARVARAQQLLRDTDCGVSDIALDCGFADQSHFTTAFRRVTGLPPQRYRLAFGGTKRAV
ncbi:MAG TPA: AraC family transcriptional regulator [Steroidobacteraceae bacterium]|jgi:AraC family transcriptional regulator|nr:AraC family transcriptional regulator [Steroidobacteraceae bacterium]